MATKIYTYQHQLGSAIISVESNGKAMYQGRMYASRQSAYNAMIRRVGFAYLVRVNEL